MTITIRNYRPGDEPSILELFAAADAVDKAERGLSENDLREWLTIPGVEPERDFFIAEVDGAPAGVIGFDIQTGTVAKHRAFTNGVTQPGYRRRGVGTRLFEAAEARAAEKMRALPPGPTCYLEAFARSTQTDLIALLESIGLKPARYFFGMIRDVRGELPPAINPDGLLIRSFRDEDDAQAYAAFDEAFRDHWGYEQMSPAEWKHFFRDTADYNPALWFMAWDGDELAGIALNFIKAEENARVGRKQGLVGELGVRRAWRKRGVATALLRRSFHAFREAGMDYAVLGVDSENPTGALGLYQRLGFEVLRENVAYRKEI